MERFLANVTVRVVLAGLFLISLVHFFQFVYAQTAPVLRPLVQYIRRRRR